MKKILMLSLVLMAILVITGSASAWGRPYYRHSPGPGFGVFIGPPFFGPPIIVGPPAYYRGYPPPYRYYDYNNRVWVPGHWGDRQTPYGWERVWVPGYWRYDY